MIEKIGEKIQVLAIISGILSAGVCIFAALICFSKDDSAGWLYVLAALIAFVLAWPLCGFGQLVEDVSAIRQQLESSTTVRSGLRCRDRQHLRSHTKIRCTF